MTTAEPIFVDLASESDDPGVTEIESVCFKCFGKGSTRLLLTKIPHYKEVIISSFECNACGDKNNSVQTGSIQELGIKYELKVENIKDLSRQIVKSDHATLMIPELDFEVPADGEKGEITTVEGVIRKAIDGLNQDQESRKSLHEELHRQINSFVTKLESLLKLETSFTLKVDDPTGNSYVENLNAPKTDPQLLLTTFHRTKQQNQSLGFQEEAENESEAKGLNSIEEEGGEENLREEVLQFNTMCDQCSRPSVTKEVVIMATECDSCGYKTNEVKSGGGIEPLGKKYSLEVRGREDLHRDVLKSETCSISIPELDLDIGSGIFVGKFTTVEGILTDVKEDLLKNPFLMGDATTDDKKIKIQNISKKIQEVINGTTSAHLNLDDPAGNSFVQDIYTPLEDPCLKVEQYERSFEQNEELGLNDMKTENYGEDS